MASIPRRVETMGADELPSGVSKAGMDFAVKYYNAAVNILNSATVPIKNAGLRKDEILQAAHYWHTQYRKFPNNPDYAKQTNEIMNSKTLSGVPEYARLVKGLARLKTGWAGFTTLFGEHAPGGPIYKQHYNTYMSQWYKDLMNGFMGAYNSVVKTYEEIIYAIRQMAATGTATWPRYLDMPSLAKIQSASGVVREVQRTQEVQRQDIGITVDTPVYVPKFSFSPGFKIPEEKNKWLLPVLIGGGALATILALKG